ncbi:MAG: SpoIIE family protein phosphatase, partial [Treponema sp.]|nr:SpoIIE family protein phosphatase [Treponema sp.]
ELCHSNTTGMFVTMWLCILEVSSGRLTYANAGHTPPMLIRGMGQGFDFLVSQPDLVLAAMEDTCYHCNQIQMEKGDMLFLYTDGIVEAEDANGAFYGKERMKAFLNANAQRPLREMLPSLRTDIATFAGKAEQSDDITMLAFRINDPTMDNVRIQLTLKADVSELDTLNDFIGKELEAAGCPARERGHVELAAEEIFVNIAKYAYENGEKASGKVTVGCRTRAELRKMEVTFTFSDCGIPFNPLEHNEPDITLPFDKRELGGLGILIVKKVIDTIQYSRENGANLLEFTKSWQKEGI